MAVLKGMSEEVEGVFHDLTETETTIGRHESNVISVDHLSVSAFHCSIVKDGEKYTMRDMDSTNGTRVDNQKVGVRRLASGNMVDADANDDATTWAVVGGEYKYARNVKLAAEVSMGDVLKNGESGALGYLMAYYWF